MTLVKVSFSSGLRSHPKSSFRLRRPGGTSVFVATSPWGRAPPLTHFSLVQASLIQSLCHFSSSCLASRVGRGLQTGVPTAELRSRRQRQEGGRKGNEDGGGGWMPFIEAGPLQACCADHQVQPSPPSTPEALPSPPPYRPARGHRGMVGGLRAHGSQDCRRSLVFHRCLWPRQDYVLILTHVRLQGAWSGSIAARRWHWWAVTRHCPPGTRCPFSYCPLVCSWTVRVYQGVCSRRGALWPAHSSGGQDGAHCSAPAPRTEGTGVLWQLSI